MQQQRTRAASFLLVMSWIYIILALGMIAYALYNLTNTSVKLTFAGVTDAVFLIIGGALGILAGIFGLASKNLKRCRLLGLILLAIAAVPLIINLLVGEPLATYWRNIAVMVLPFLYLIAALVKRSEKKPVTVLASNTPYAPTAPQPAPIPQPVAQAESKPAEPEKKPEKQPQNSDF